MSGSSGSLESGRSIQPKERYYTARANIQALETAEDYKKKLQNLDIPTHSEHYQRESGWLRNVLGQLDNILLGTPNQQHVVFRNAAELIEKYPQKEQSLTRPTTSAMAPPTTLSQIERVPTPLSEKARILTEKLAFIAKNRKSCRPGGPMVGTLSDHKKAMRLDAPSEEQVTAATKFVAQQFQNILSERFGPIDTKLLDKSIKREFLELKQLSENIYKDPTKARTEMINTLTEQLALLLESLETHVSTLPSTQQDSIRQMWSEHK